MTAEADAKPQDNKAKTAGARRREESLVTEVGACLLQGELANAILGSLRVSLAAARVGSDRRYVKHLSHLSIRVEPRINGSIPPPPPPPHTHRERERGKERQTHLMGCCSQAC